MLGYDLMEEDPMALLDVGPNTWDSGLHSQRASFGTDCDISDGFLFDDLSTQGEVPFFTFSSVQLDANWQGSMDMPGTLSNSQLPYTGSTLFTFDCQPSLMGLPGKDFSTAGGFVFDGAPPMLLDAINTQQVETANVKKRKIPAMGEPLPSVISNSQIPPSNRDPTFIGVSELSKRALADRIPGKPATAFEQTRAFSFNRLDRVHCPPLPNNDDAEWISVQAKTTISGKKDSKEPCEEMTCESGARLLHTGLDKLYQMGLLPKDEADWMFRNIFGPRRYRAFVATVMRMSHACLRCRGVKETEIGHKRLTTRKRPKKLDRSLPCTCGKDGGNDGENEGGNDGGNDGGNGGGGARPSTSESNGQSQSQSPSSQNSGSSGSTSNSAGSSSNFTFGGSLTAAKEASDSTIAKIDATLHETQSANTYETPDQPSQPTGSPASPVELPRNGKNAATSQDSEGAAENAQFNPDSKNESCFSADKLAMKPKIEADVERDQPDPSQVDSLAQQLSQVAVSDGLAPIATQADDLAQQMSQVVLNGADPGDAATPQRTAIKLPSATSSGSTSKPARSLLINHNNANGVTLYTVGRPESYIEVVKEKNPLAETLEFSAGEVNDLLQAIEMHARSSLTKQGNPTWKGIHANLAWDVAKEFQKQTETNSPEIVQTPAEAPPSTPSSLTNRATRAILINNAMNRVTLYTVGRPERPSKCMHALDDANLAWDVAKEFQNRTETKSPVIVQTPAEAPPSTPSSSTTKRARILLINQNDPMKGVTLYTVRRPEKYLEAVKEKNPLAEALEFSIEEFESFLQTIEKTRSSLTSGGNLTWKYENAKLAWGSAKEFSETSDAKSGLLVQTETKSPANVQTPAKVLPPTANSSISEPTRALLINSPMQGVAPGENICSPQSHINTVKTENPLVEDRVEIPTRQVNPVVQATETSALAMNLIHTWTGEMAAPVWRLAISSAENPTPMYSVAN
ncbi:hypothetical protein HDU77_010809 [Chytriomyces hyalinus]|nr:hypothetical protein HDU77_010809 [Chytriomyces hyalinus]